MDRNEEQRDDLIELGAATEETKGFGVIQPPDSPTPFRLNAELVED